MLSALLWPTVCLAIFLVNLGAVDIRRIGSNKTVCKKEEPVGGLVVKEPFSLDMPKGLPTVWIAGRRVLMGIAFATLVKSCGVTTYCGAQSRAGAARNRRAVLVARGGQTYGPGEQIVYERLASMSASSLIFLEHVDFSRETAEVTPLEAEQCGCRFIVEVQARHLFASKDDRIPSETPRAERKSQWHGLCHSRCGGIFFSAAVRLTSEPARHSRRRHPS